MKIGEVRVAEDSDFALLKVTMIIIIVETNIFIIIMHDSRKFKISQIEKKYTIGK